MPTWNMGDTIAAKNSKAQVIAADGKGWVKVRQDGQESLQKQHGYDNELASHLADGVIDGALAWGCN